jgi:hypothetical protein
MNKVIIKCDELVDKYKLNKDCIMKQLQSMKVNKGTEGFITAYNDDFRYTLVGEIKENQVVLTNIEKAIAFRRMDNTDLFEFVKKGQGL